MEEPQPQPQPENYELGVVYEFNVSQLRPTQPRDDRANFDERPIE